MKRNFLTLLVVVTVFFSANAQIDFGLKAGVNYDFSGDITQIESAANDIKHGANSKMGYHAGVWLKAEFLNIFIRPELVYTQLEKEYSSLSAETIKTKKIDVPVVLGTKVLGPVYLFGGPSFQYIMGNDFSVTNSEISTDDFTVGLNLGAGVALGNFGLEIRWEKGLTQDDKAKILNYGTGNFEIDNRPNQLIFSLNYKLN